MQRFERWQVEQQVKAASLEVARTALAEAKKALADVELDKKYMSALSKQRALVERLGEEEKAATTAREKAYYDIGEKLGLLAKIARKGHMYHDMRGYTPKLVAAFEKAIGWDADDERELARSQFEHPMAEALDKYVERIIYATPQYKAVEKAEEKATAANRDAMSKLSTMDDRLADAEWLVRCWQERVNSLQARLDSRSKPKAITPQEKEDRKAEREHVEKRRTAKRNIEQFRAGGIKLVGFPPFPKVRPPKRRRSFL